MNMKETSGVLAVLREAYPQFYRGEEDAEAKHTTAFWKAMFADDDCTLVSAAVKAIIAGSERDFPPTIGQIKAKMRDLQTPDEVTEGEAWNLVSKALRNGIYGAKEEFAKLPERVQKLVGSAEQLREWAMMDADTVQSVVASNFQRSYKVRTARDREYLAIPADVKNAIRGLTAAIEMKSLPDAKGEGDDYENS